MKYCVHFIFNNKDVLLLKRKESNPFHPSIWTPVIGKIKLNEDPKTAIIRETLEETMLTIKQSTFYKMTIFNYDEYFIYYSNWNKQNIVINHENHEFDFFNIHELPQSLWSFFKTNIFSIAELTK